MTCNVFGGTLNLAQSCSIQSTHPGSPGQNPKIQEGHKTVVCVCVCVHACMHMDWTDEFFAVPILDTGNQHCIRHLRCAGITAGCGIYAGVVSQVSAKPVIICITDPEHGKWQRRVFLKHHF